MQGAAAASACAAGSGVEMSSGRALLAPIAALWVACATCSSAAHADLKQRVDAIFIDEAYAARNVDSVRWEKGGAAYTMLETSASAPPGLDVVRYRVDTGAREVVLPATRLVPSGSGKPITVEDHALSADGNWVLLFADARRRWRRKTLGRYWLYDRRHGSLRPVGGGRSPDNLMYAAFSPDGSRVAYVRDSDLYVESVATGAIERLTQDGSADVLNGVADWVNEEELHIYDAFSWSPDSRRIAYWQFDTRAVGRFTLVDNTAGLYPSVRQMAWPKAGTTNSAVRIGVVDVGGGRVRWMSLPGDPREHYVPRIRWLDDSRRLAIQQLDRSQKRLVVWLADARTGTAEPFFEDEDDAWVDVSDPPLWTAKDREMLVLSDRSGWRRLYAVSRADRRVRCVTPDGFDVVSVVAQNPGDPWVYYVASPRNATQRYLYRSRKDGHEATERLSAASEPGTHAYVPSPDGRWAFHTYSTLRRPPVTDLVRLSDHRRLRVVEDNHELRERASLLFGLTEFFQVATDEGVTLDGWMIKPPEFDAAKRYPVIVYVYGGPWTATVNDAWGGPSRSATNLFHQALAREGYVVLSMDNRGTPAPKGRAWRKAMHGQLDIPTTVEQPRALRALLESRPYLDAQHIGVWGWSSGGSNTLNLLFRSPELYKVGVAVSPMPVQRYYDTIYNERYLGMPQQNPEAYRRSSTLEFAAGLQGKLLLIHGAADDNTPIQVSQLLIERLVELGKPFDFMEYPQGTHSLDTSKAMLAHVHNRIGRHFLENLPPAPNH